jgi:hypothetical protein
MNKGKLEGVIVGAFADIEVPPDWALVRSNEGPEAVKIEQAFRGRTDW